MGYEKMIAILKKKLPTQLLALTGRQKIIF